MESSANLCLRNPRDEAQMLRVERVGFEGQRLWRDALPRKSKQDAPIMDGIAAMTLGGCVVVYIRQVAG